MRWTGEALWKQRESFLARELCYDQRNASQVDLLRIDKNIKECITMEIKHVPVTSRLPRDFLFVPPADAEELPFVPADKAGSCLLFLLASRIAAPVGCSTSIFTHALEAVVATAIIKPS
jgi:hypothetical protein